MYITLLLLQVSYYSSFLEQLHKAAQSCSFLQKCLMAILSNTHKVNVEKFTFGGQNLHEGWAQSCTSVAVWLVFSVISPLASQHRWRFICCLLPLDSFFPFSIPNPIPPLSGACLPAEVLYLAACLSDSLSYSCGCCPPSVAITANRHAIGPFQLMILLLGLNHCCSVNPLPHIFFFSRQISWSLLLNC